MTKKQITTLENEGLSVENLFIKQVDQLDEKM